MKEATEARESNKGDNFHFIWSAKKSLQLLEPGTELEAFYVEGTSIEDDEKSLLSIDVAEYFEGKNMKMQVE
ncbi:MULTISPECIES: hypothetical protein [unclassified Clostridioides]|uniref:hypothetical protein n=1 Tax=unclassified Clostridioides TaxID=2635829 RepID=UPI001D1158A4